VRKIEARNTREINTVLIWAVINNLAQAYAFMTAVLNISTRSELPAAANGSNRIALTCPPSSNINAVICLDDLY
jgi:hypothetical protein